MSYRGKVRNGVVVLPVEAKLADGTEVEITPLPENGESDAFVEGMLKLSKDRDWPDDFALNHGHYLKGHAKKT